MAIQRTRTVSGQRVSNRFYLAKLPSTSMEILLIRLSQETLKTQQHALHIQNCTPLLFQDIQTNTTAEVDVGVIDRSLENDVRRCIRVVGWEVEGKFECEVLVGRVRGAGKRGGPGEEGVAGRESGDTGCGGRHECHEFGLQPIREPQVSLCNRSSWQLVLVLTCLLVTLWASCLRGAGESLLASCVLGAPGAEFCVSSIV